MTNNGSCGPAFGNTVCGSWSTGGCCSAHGYCGNTIAYCGDGCQSGPCFPSTTETTITSDPVCPGNNNTRYQDIYSTTYDVRCGLLIVGAQGYPAHADTFTKCLEYCDILGGCAGVTYNDPAASTDGNCIPYSTFTGYSASTLPNTYSGVATNGPTVSAATDALCPADNGTTYNDAFGNTYNIGCDLNLAGNGPSTGGNFWGTYTSNLDACLLYCSIYLGCNLVDFLASVTASSQANCFPYVNATSAPATAQSGSQYAQRP